MELKNGNLWPLHDQTAAHEPKNDGKYSVNKSKEEDITGEGIETTLAVACTDTGPFIENPEFLKDWLKKLIAQSQFGVVYHVRLQGMVRLK